MKRAFIRILALLFSVSAMLSAQSCSLGGKNNLDGDKNVLPRTYELTGQAYNLTITGLSFGASKVNIVTLDETQKDALVITTDDNVFSSLKVEIDGENITITGDETKVYLPSELEITLGVPASSVTLDGAWTLGGAVSGVKSFSLTVNGAAQAELVTERLDSMALTVNGAAAITLEGFASSFIAEVNGTANLDAKKFETEYCEATLSGASNAAVNVTDTLKASINGTANISYRGDPQNVEKSISGLGVIEPESAN